MLSEGTFRHNLRPLADVLLIGTRLIDTWRRLANPLSAKPRNAWSSGIRVTATSWPLHREIGGLLLCQRQSCRQRFLAEMVHKIFTRFSGRPLIVDECLRRSRVESPSPE